MTTFSAADLEKLATYDYDPTAHIGRPIYGLLHHRPAFTMNSVDMMLLDARVQLGLNLIKGPIHAYTQFYSQEEAQNPAIHMLVMQQADRFHYTVETEDEEVGEFVLRTLKRFWTNGVIKALTAIEWGFSGSEVIYERGQETRIEYKDLRCLNVFDVRPVTYRGGLVGMDIQNATMSTKYLGIPKAFWHVHCRESHPFYGKSRLHGAWGAFWEMWSESGARDIRRTWFHRCAYDGGSMRYPIGKSAIPGGGSISNRDIALEMMAKKRTGGYLVMPNQIINGVPAWEYDPPSGSQTPEGVMQYPEDLRKEILEGMGIPPEIIEGGGGGLGAATGRMVPMLAYQSTLKMLTEAVINDFKSQVMDYLIMLNWGRLPSYNIIPIVPAQALAPQMQEGGPGEGVPEEDQTGEEDQDQEGEAPPPKSKTPPNTKPKAPSSQNAKEGAASRGI